MPTRWPWLVRGFRKYATGYLRKNFHAVRLAKTSAEIPDGDGPLLLVLNHPSWWDALLPIALLDRFPPDFEHFAAIDARALQKYRIFTRLGFFGVDTQSLRGAAEFLRVGEAILSHPRRAVWVTAQGRFTDARVRPLALQSGVGHLAARLETGTVLPIAIEYTFWTERTPEALIRIGEPLPILAGRGMSGREWTARIESNLTDALDSLAGDAMSRDPSRFTTLIGGTAGVGGIYDRWRKFRAWIRREKFDPSHGGADA